MFLRYTTRKKNGKEHRYYSLVENKRVAGGHVVQRHALYLGEINVCQQEAWRKTEPCRARFPAEASSCILTETRCRSLLSFRVPTSPTFTPRYFTRELCSCNPSAF